MKTYLRLVRHLISNLIGSATIAYERRQGKRPGLRAVAIGFAIVYLGGLMMFMTGAFGRSLFQGQPGLLVATMGLTTILVLSQLGGIFLELRSSSGLLGWSKDSPLLFSLPIRKTTVFLARLTLTIGGSLLMQLVLLGPVFFFYLQWAGWTAESVIKALITLLCAPLMPTLVSAVLALVFMRISALSRHRDALLIAVSLLAFIIVIPLSQWLSYGIMGSMDPAAMAAMLSDPGGLASILSAAWPPAGWAAQGMANAGLAGWGWMALFVGVSALALALTAALGAWLYQKGATAQNEAASRKKRGKLRVISASAFAALHAREWKLLLRSPIFAMNGLAGMLIVPIMLIMPTLSGGGENPYLQMLDAFGSQSVATAIACFLLFVTAINPASATAISREGKTLWIVRMLPIGSQTLVRAKLLMGSEIGVIGGLLLVGVGAFMLPLDAAAIAFTAFLAVTAGVACSALSIYIDLSRPRLVWDSETYVIKQNMNVMMAMGACLLLGVVLALPLFLVPGLPGQIISAVLSLAAAIAAVSALNAAAVPKLNQAAG